ncbi:MAG: hypothetical protein LUH14_10270 [Clostridiaceae bacterium]|nr:hypothetical protein [Clostridiaceae bacterium]
MNIKKFAKSISGKEYGTPQFTKEEIQIAKNNKWVIVYGASDDLMELDGYIHDETEVYDGGIVHIQLPYNHESGSVIGGGVVGNYGLQNVMSIIAKWCEDKDSDGNVISWTYDTSVPHEEFNIFEDGEIYCRGIVFAAD